MKTIIKRIKASVAIATLCILGASSAWAATTLTLDAGDNVLQWNQGSTEAALNDASHYNALAKDGGDETVATSFSATDRLFLNKNLYPISATMSFGTLTAAGLYLSYGMNSLTSYDAESGWNLKVDLSSSHGAELAMTGGEIALSDVLWIGGPYADSATAYLAMSGDAKITAKTLSMGENNSGVPNYVNKFSIADNAVLNLTGTGDTARFGIYSASSNEVAIAGGTITTAGNCSFGADGTTIASMTGGTLNVGSEFILGDGNNATVDFTLENATVESASYVCIGRSGTGRKVKMTIGNGGNLLHTGGKGNLVIGNLVGVNSSNELVVNEGGYVRTYNDICVGESGPAVLTVNGGLVQAQLANGNARWVYMNSGSANYNTVLNLNGGVLATASLRRSKTSEETTATVNFNGGTLRATHASSEFVPAATGFSLNFLENGGTIDTEGNADTIAAAITGTGVLTKKGLGTLTLSGTFSAGGVNAAEGVLYVSPVSSLGAATIDGGVLSVPQGSSFGAVTIGSGALGVRISDVTEDGEITLFTATSIDIEGENQTLADGIFLIGTYASDYTLSQTEADGVITVKATLSGVDTSHTMALRILNYKYTSSGQAGASSGYLDNGRTYIEGYSNQPSQYDTVVACGDNYAWGYAANTGKFRRLLVRGGRLTITSGNSSPNLYCKYIGGNGTIQLNNANGFISNVASEETKIAAGVTLDFKSTSRIGVDSMAGTISVDATSYVTNGAAQVKSGVALNGDVCVGGTSSASLTIDSGVTFGSGMRLVLVENVAAPTITNSTGNDFPKVVVEGGNYALASLPAATATEITGGAVSMAYDATRALTVSGGKILVDLSGKTDAEEGTEVTLSNLTISDGATYSIVVSGSTLEWTLDATGANPKLTAGTAATGNNIWIGGATGNWYDAANWKFGVPDETSIVQFDTPATVGIQSENKCGGMVLNADVTIQYYTGLHDSWPRFWLYGDVSGEGTLTAIRVGPTNKKTGNLTIGCPFRSIGTNGKTDADTYLEGDSDSYYFNFTNDVEITGKFVAYRPAIFRGNVTINDNSKMQCNKWVTFDGTGKTIKAVDGAQADISLSAATSCNMNLSGNLAITASSTITLSGDNSGFTGSFSLANGSTFSSASSGSAAASWTLTGDIYFGFETGTIYFGQLTASASGNSQSFAFTTDGAVATISIGAKGDSVVNGKWWSGYNSGSTWNTSKATVTLEKTGDTTLTLPRHDGGLDNIDLKAGTLVTTTDYTLDTNGGAGTSSLTVASGACLNPAISSSSTPFTATTVTLADGAVIDAKYEGVPPGTYKIAAGTITDNGAVAMVNGLTSESYTLSTADGLSIVVADYVAAVDDGTTATTYTTLQAALDAAPASGADMTVLLSGSAAPTVSTAKAFGTLRLVYTGSDPITVDLSGVSATEVVAPANVTLTLGDSTITGGSISGTLNIPEGTTITITDSSVVSSITGVTGAGRLVLQGFYPAANTAIRTSVTNSSKWTGTLELKDVELGTIDAAYYGNASSTVAFNGATGYARASHGSSTEVGKVNTIEICSGGLTFNNQYSSGSADVFIFAADLTGSGPIHFATKHQQSDKSRYEFTGDVSEFTGAVDYGSLSSYRAVVVFKNADETTPSPTDWGQIIVTEGKTVNVSATWFGAGGFIVNGTMNVLSGGSITYDSNGKLVNGTGTISFAVLPTSGLSFTTWSGTVVLPETTISTKTSIPLTSLSTANSTLVIKGITRSTASNSIYLGTGATATINGTVQLDGDLHVTDGNSNATYTWNKITGSGNIIFTTAGGSASGITHSISTLSDYSGTLENGGSAALTIGDIAFTETTPALGEVLVKAATSATFTDLASTTLNGAAADLVLDTAAATPGIYVAIASVTADETTTKYGTLATAVAAAEAASVTTFTALVAEPGYYNGWTLDNGTFTKNSNVARIGTTEYDTLANAVSAATSGDTIVLFRNSAEGSSTIAEGITLEIESGVTPAGTFTGGGKIVLKSDTFTTSTLEGYWAGELVVDWAVTAGLNVGKYGRSSSTITINQDMSGYLTNDNADGNPNSGAMINIPEGVTVTIKDGWPSKDQKPVVGGLTGAGNLVLDGSAKTGWTANFPVTATVVSDFTGTVTVGDKFTFKIGTFDLPTSEVSRYTAGTRLAAITLTDSGALVNSDGADAATAGIAVSVGGTANNSARVVYDTDGLYPAVASMTANDTTTYYTSLVKAVAAAEEAGVTSLSVLVTPLNDDRVEGWKYNSDAATYTKQAAKIDSTYYDTIQDAIDAVDADADLSLSDITVILSDNVPNGYTVVGTSLYDNRTSTWTDSTGDHAWNTAANWSADVVPGEYTAVTIPAGDYTIYLRASGDKAGSLAVNGTLKLRYSSDDWTKWPFLTVYGDITGSGSLTIYRAGIQANTMVNVSCDFIFDGPSTSSDTFITGNSQSGTGWNFTKSVTFSGGALSKIENNAKMPAGVTIACPLTIGSGAAYTSTRDVTITGTTTLNGNLDKQESGRLVFGDVTVAAASSITISGGSMTFGGATTVSGDWALTLPSGLTVGESATFVLGSTGASVVSSTDISGKVSSGVTGYALSTATDTPAAGQTTYSLVLDYVVVNNDTGTIVVSGSSVELAFNNTSGSATLTCENDLTAANAVTVYATDASGAKTSTDITAAFTVTAGENNTYTVALDGTKTVDSVKVAPEVDTTAETPFNVSASSVGLTMKTIPGLWYGMAASDTPNGTYTVQNGEDAVKQATGASLTLSADLDSEATVKFYRVKTGASKAALDAEKASPTND